MSRPYYQRAGWRWLPGMRTLEEVRPPRCLPYWDAARVISADPDEPGVRQVDRDTTTISDDASGAVVVVTVCGLTRPLHVGAMPDLTDPATQGAALAVLREVTGDARLSVACAGHPVGRWYLIYGRATTAVVGDIAEATEAKALAAALDHLIPE